MKPEFQSQQISIYNTLSGQKEKFVPIEPGNIGMYVCGPTVYSNVHLGNVRTFMSFDVIFRYFKYLGYKVRYVRNITDVGHIVDDVDDGEDKIAKRARLEKVEPMEIVQKYTLDFHETLRLFNFLAPSIEPTATGHLIEQIEIVREIIDAGYGYEANGSIYFDVVKFNQRHDYGKLSGRNLEDMLANTRELEGQTDKRNAADFALWKKAEPQHIMRWPSPWSDGFPGWHLECTAMSTKYLGNHFDIHGGGLDLKFPHHECEIAQSEAAKNTDPVNYWMHANMLTLNGKKMAKSTGNNILPMEILTGNSPFLSKGYSAGVARFFMLQAHYRSILDFSDDAIVAAEKGFIRLMDAMDLLDKLTASAKSSIDVNAWKQKCFDAMNDDFNTPILIAHLFEGVKFVHLVNEGKESFTAEDLKILSETMNGFIHKVLGIEADNKSTNNAEQTDGLVKMLIDVRNSARANKDFAMSDQIRDKLATLGVEIKDGKDGTTFSTR